MEPAPLLRPVPSRRPGPIAPAEAVRHTRRELPGLDEPAAEALALIALVGRSREEAGDGTGLYGEELAGALARGRKALRRKLHPLPGSGWCERAERLISDRIDGALEDPGPARLEAHLTNCSRCVEHERHLTHAQDALVAGFVDAHAATEPGPERLPDPPAVEQPPNRFELHVVTTPALPPTPAQRALPVPPPAAEVEAPPAEVVAPPAPEPVVAETEVVAPPAPEPVVAEAPPVTVVAPPFPAPGTPSVPAQPPASAASPPAPLPPPPRPAPWRGYEAPPRPVLTTRPSLEAESTWTTVGPLVVVLTLAVVLFALAGVLATGI